VKPPAEKKAEGGRMLGYLSIEMVDKITPAHIFQPETATDGYRRDGLGR
jgi:hypothetical protein